MAEQQNVLTAVQAARYIGVSQAVLRFWRSRGEGPRFFRAGEKLVRYRRVDLDSWIESRLSGPDASPPREQSNKPKHGTAKIANDSFAGGSNS